MTSAANPRSMEPWPEKALERVPQCPSCTSGSRELLYSDLTDRVFFTAPGSWALYRCLECQSAYLDPRPTPESISLAYDVYYTHNSELASPVRSRPLRKQAKALANSYWNRIYGSDLTPQSALGVYLAPLVPRVFRRALDRRTRLLPAEGGRLLDVGCGNGDYLAFAEHLGWDAMGVEPDPQAAASAQGQGLSVLLGDLGALNGHESEYDAITLSHVIEHVHDPAALLSDIHRLLKPTGMLWLDTPNLDSWSHQRFTCCWRGLEPPRHLVLFNSESLSGLLRQVGFTKIQLWTDIFASTTSASQAIAAGRDPYSESPTPWRDRLSDVRRLWQVWRAPHLSDFLTFTAVKPKETS